MANNLPSLAPKTFEDAIKFSEMLSKSDFVPNTFKNKPGDILAAIQMGYEVGLSPMAALQNIAVINGRPSIWGDALLAIVQASGKLEYIKETDDGTCATCEVKRIGDRFPCISTFSDKDAQAAGLLDKQGPWKQYRPRMRKSRARGFALRDKFADVVKGVITREEAIDITPMTEEVQQLDVGALTEEETPRAVEMVVDGIPLMDSDYVEVGKGEADEPATPAEQKAFMDFVKGRNRPQDIALIKLTPGWTDVKHATKLQIAAAREALENAK